MNMNMNCPCDKFGDKFGCGDGYTHCGGHCLTGLQGPLAELRRWICQDLTPGKDLDPALKVTPIMHNEGVIILQLHGWSINLYADGTWIAEDTSGG